MPVRDLWATIRRGSSRQEALVTLGLLVAAIVGFGAPATFGTDSPRSAAVAYLSAASRADAAGMLEASDVRPELAGKVDASLLDEAALKEALPTLMGKPADVQVGEPSPTDPVSVAASYRVADATHQVRLTLDKVFIPLRVHPVWKVRVLPAVFSAQVAAAAGDLTVDGRRVPGSAGKSVSVAVFPGLHVLSTTGGPLMVGEGSPYDTASTSGLPATVFLKLTPLGDTAVHEAVNAAFKGCTTGSSSCSPEALGAGSKPTLTLVGDPLNGATDKPDPIGVVNVFGHFHFVETVGSGVDTRHLPVSGGYSLKLRPSGNGFTPGPPSPYATVSPAIRPVGAGDQAILDAVRPALVTCAAAMVAKPADCPQTINANATDVQWTLQGDPLAGATVTFDPDADLFKVAGRLTMGVSYNSSLLGIGLHTDSSAIFPFTADLFWDGSKPVLVTIQGN